MFDKEKFGYIIRKINDVYPTQYDFADISDVNRTYLSQYINKKLSAPPKPDILKKIANASKGITTYNELMQICGYIPQSINNSESLDMQLSKNIFNSNIHLLDKYDLSDSDILELKKILIERDNNHSSIENQLNDFAIHSSSNAKELFATLININDDVSRALVNLHKNGYLYPIPVYRNTKNIDLLLVSNIVDYTNYNVPVDMSFNDFFALLIDTDKMFPLLDVNDIAIIQKVEDLENGQIVAVYSTTQERCLIGKLFKYENIIELSYLNSKSEKFIVNDIKFLGKVIKAENQSAFK